MKKTIKDYVISFITPKYTFVPPCPRCESVKTGYFIQTNNPDTVNIHISKAKKGELVKCVSSYEMCSNNMFCSECGFEWRGLLEKKELTSELIQEEKEKRGITPEFGNDFKTNYVLTAKTRKEIKKENKKKKKVSYLKKAIQANIPFFNELTSISVNVKEKKKFLKEIDEQYAQSTNETETEE